MEVKQSFLELFCLAVELNSIEKGFFVVIEYQGYGNGFGVFCKRHNGISVYFNEGRSVDLTKENLEKAYSWLHEAHDKLMNRSKPKFLNGVNIPDISFMPSFGDSYLCPVRDGSFSEVCWKGDLFDHYALELDACYPATEDGEFAAKQHALALGWVF